MAQALHWADGRVLTLDRPRIVGVLNVTPDSFSDGGRYLDESAAVEQAWRMLAEGANVIDIGGESTRPGAQRVDVAEQKRRVVGVIHRITQQTRALISIDTTQAEVAQAALDAGATMLNDISAGREDERMFTLAAERGVPIVLMHMLGQPATMQNDPVYADVVRDVLTFLRERRDAAVAAGIAAERIVIDPGIGFGKTFEHNLKLLAHLDRFVAMGSPVLLGASRKRFLRQLCADDAGRPAEPTDVIGGTCATTALAVAAGVRLIRVHDVKPNRHAADVAFAITHPKQTQE